MADNIRKEVRRVLDEEMGVQNDVEKMTHKILDWTYRNLEFNLDSISDGSEYKISMGTGLGEYISSENNISEVITDIHFKNTNKGSVSGKFISKESTLKTDKTYKVKIRVVIHTNHINKVKSKVKSVIAYELNHAFVYIKKKELKSKSFVYNKVKNMMGPTFQHIEPLKEFMTMFYLNLPDEIQARVQEAGSMLLDIEADNYNDAIQELYFYQPINDAKRMAKYEPDKVLELSSKTLDSFLKTFNKDIELSKNKLNFNDIEFKIIKGPEEFFNYWTKFIRFGGVKLNKKILKLVANKFNIAEHKIMVELDEELLVEIFKINYL